MLTPENKEYLYEIIASVIGDDPTIKSYQMSFNDSTVEVVEDMLESESNCNETMKDLLVGLTGASGRAASGWLKKALKAQKIVLKKIEFKGYGCLVSLKSRWKSRIISSAI